MLNSLPLKRERVHSVSGCFQPARGVIHPSFPLRGRWERPALVLEQAPSPSLENLCKSSTGMRPHSLGSARNGPIPRPFSVTGIPYFSSPFCIAGFSEGAQRFQLNPESGARSPASGIDSQIASSLPGSVHLPLSCMIRVNNGDIYLHHLSGSCVANAARRAAESKRLFETGTIFNLGCSAQDMNPLPGSAIDST